MCMKFGCNLQINLCYIFRSLNLVNLAQLLPKHIGTGYLMKATPSTTYPYLFETLQVFLSRSEDVHLI